MTARYVALLLALALLSTSLPAPAISPSPITFVVTDDVMRVVTSHYSLSLNLKRGLSLLSWSAGGVDIEWREADAVVLDMCSLEGIEKGAQPLSGAEWSHEVLVSSRDVLRISLKPKAETSCLSPLSVSVVVSFYSWLPYIEAEIKVSNPTDRAVKLVGSRGAPALSFGLPPLAGSRAALVALDSSGLTLHEDPGAYSKPLLQSSALALYVNGSLKLIYGVSDLSRDEHALVVLGDSEEGARFSVLFSPRELGPGAAIAFGFKLALIPSDPVIASLAGLAPVYAALEPDKFKEMLELLPIEKYVENVTQTIRSLNKTNMELTARARELESLVEFWKREVRIREDSLRDLEARLKRQGLLVTGVALLSIALGFLGGALAYRAKVEHERGRVVRRR